MLVRESVSEAVEQSRPLREYDRLDDFTLDGLETDRPTGFCGLRRGIVIRIVVVRRRVDHRERKEISQQMAFADEMRNVSAGPLQGQRPRDLTHRVLVLCSKSRVAGFLPLPFAGLI